MRGGGGGTLLGIATLTLSMEENRIWWDYMPKAKCAQPQTEIDVVVLNRQGGIKTTAALK
jgi:hypothetical protein